MARSAFTVSRNIFAHALIITSIVLFDAHQADADTTGVVRGSVMTQAKPAAGIAVTLTGEGSVFNTLTGSDGRFSFLHVPYGRYMATARSSTGVTIEEDVDLQSNAVVDLPIDLSPKQIGRSQTTTTRGVASKPVSVNTIDRAQIAASPENQSLNRLVETFPGIVRFSYNEPVAHGFHGLSYELDGIPLPQSTASQFSEVIDPRSIDSLEVFTGAFPAEFGGSRQGAVVNLISQRSNTQTPEAGDFTAGFGSYGQLQTSLRGTADVGTTHVYVSNNLERSNRGIDSPTFTPEHDNASSGNQFLRTITDLGKNDTLAFDASHDTSLYQIPINTSAGNSNDPITSVPGTDDGQREDDSFFTLAYTHNAANGNGYTQLAPYYKYDRIAYAGDLAEDLLEMTNGVANTGSGLIQDRHSTFSGLRLTQFNVFGPHSVKAGIDASLENFSGNERIAYFPTLPDGTSAPTPGSFFDTSSQRGTNFGAYLEDTWTPSAYVSLQAGLRYDHSTGYVSGSQLSPRFEINGKLDSNDILHFYYGRLYAAPFLEDTRAAAVIIGGTAGALPAYDLKPEHDQYYEIGLAHQLTSTARATVNLWKRDVQNVLDTTQLANTPVFAVFNNTIGVAKGVEGRVDSRWRNGDMLFFSTTLSKSLAGGISGGTFLFPPSTDPNDVTLNPEDHDQTFAADLGYTKKLGRGRGFFATLEPQYGTGYPVLFQNGPGRLPPHLTFNAAFGRDAGRGRDHALGYQVDFQNLTNTQYILKIANGFNTTQYAEGIRATFQIIAPL